MGACLGRVSQEAPALNAPKLAANNGYLQRLNTFAGASRMKRLMLKLLANEEAALTTQEVARLRVSGDEMGRRGIDLWRLWDSRRAACAHALPGCPHLVVVACRTCSTSWTRTTTA